MTPAPCRYCHQPPQPPGVACPSFRLNFGSIGRAHGCEATTGEPSAEAVEMAQEACGCGMCELRKEPGLENCICDRGTRVARCLDAFAARAVSAERERLRHQVEFILVAGPGTAQDAFAQLVADLRRKP